MAQYLHYVYKHTLNHLYALINRYSFQHVFVENRVNSALLDNILMH
jgi:hypothetical protein